MGRELQPRGRSEPNRRHQNSPLNKPSLAFVGGAEGPDARLESPPIRTNCRSFRRRQQQMKQTRRGEYVRDVRDAAGLRDPKQIAENATTPVVQCRLCSLPRVRQVEKQPDIFLLRALSPVQGSTSASTGHDQRG